MSTGPLFQFIKYNLLSFLQHIYRDGQFEKPFFTTYFKTSMFSLYLLGLCFWPPWRDTCNRPPAYMVKIIWQFLNYTFITYTKSSSVLLVHRSKHRRRKLLCRCKHKFGKQSKINFFYLLFKVVYAQNYCFFIQFNEVR